MGKMIRLAKATITLYLSFLFLPLLVQSCTLSFQNVMTHGVASDVVDSDPTTETKTDAQVEVPLAKVGATSIP